MKITPSPRAKVQPLPQLILAGRILQVGSADLERAIMRELEENPALELAEDYSPSWEGAPSATLEEEETRDPLEQAAAEVPLEEYLIQQMIPLLQQEQMPIAQVLVESLDTHGILTTSLEEIAELASVSEKEVAEVLSILQEQEPRGIGARSVQECLLLQLREMEEEDNKPSQKMARTLIAEHWEELGKASLPRLAKTLEVRVEQIEEALDFIRHNLNPFPAHAYSSSSEVSFVRPDVILNSSPEAREEISIEFPEEGRYQLRVNPLYQELSSSSRPSPEISDEERERLRASSERARLFISSLEQRWKTLRRVIEELLSEQRDFFLHGPRHLHPLTRSQLAAALGIHESTVSRAVSDKFLQLPSGHVVPLGDFFDGSLAIKERIQEIVGEETNPLSDAQVASRLRQDGIRVARRTVAKYREALGILPANLRHPRGSKSGP